MKNVCIFFQIHHPFSLQTFRFFDIGEAKSYYNEFEIEKEIRNSVEKNYLPANELIRGLISKYYKKFNVSFNITDTTLDQFLIYYPNIVTGFRELAETGQAEFTGNQASHSIASLSEKENEFIRCIKLGQKRVEYYFGQKPGLFVNTDLLFDNHVAAVVAKAGYAAIFTNGIGKVLQWKSPNYIYSAESERKIKVLFRNENFSNELSIALGCLEKSKAFKLVDKLLASLNSINLDEPLVNIYINYSSLGGPSEALKHEIFTRFVSQVIESDTLEFALPSNVIDRYTSVSEVGTNEPVCWVEQFHPTYYPGNELQKEAIKQLFRNSKRMSRTDDSNLKTNWQYLQSADHFHLMDENHPDYRFKEIRSRAFKSKYEAYINYMNILSDFRLHLKLESKKKKEKRHWRNLLEQTPNAKFMNFNE